MKKLFSVVLSLALCFNLIMPVPLALATVSSETDTSSYSCNGTTTAYTYQFKIWEDDDVLVIKKQTSTGTETTLTLDSDYTVSGEGDATGTVTLTTGSVCASGYTLHLIRNVELTQETDYVDGDVFSAESFENALDKLTMDAIALDRALDRTFKIPITESGNYVVSGNSTARVSKVIGFDSNGTALELYDNPATAMATATVAAASASVSASAASTNATNASNSATTATTQASNASNSAAAAAASAADASAATKVSKSGDTMEGLLNFNTGSNIASAASLNLSTATGNLVHITGTTETTAVTMNEGQVQMVVADDVWPLTYHATNLKLNGGVNYTCIAGDRILFFYDGTTVYATVFPQAGVAVNSIRVATSVSGTVDAITAVHSPTFPAWVDKMRGIFRATGTSTSATPTFAPDGLTAKTIVKENLAAFASGDIAGAGHEVSWIYNSASDNVVLLNPKAQSTSKFIQAVKYQTGGLISGTGSIPLDDTIPQNTEGTEVMSVAITPTSASSILIIRVTIINGFSGTSHLTGALFQDATANSLAAAVLYYGSTEGKTLTFTHTMTAGTTSSTTFKVRIGPAGGETFYFNGYGSSAGRLYGGVAASSITVEEYTP